MIFWGPKNLLTYKRMQKYNFIYLGGASMSEKGRPKAEKPRSYKVSARLTEEEYCRLKAYTSKSKITMAQMLRNSIIKLIAPEE